MKACPAIVAALPREIAALVKGWEQRELAGRVNLYLSDQAVVACAGMGSARVTLAVQAALAARPVTSLLSAGLAGGCDPAVRAGEIVRAGKVIDSSTGEHFDCMQQEPVLVTSSAIASVHEKARLHASYRATAVDMEAATVARIARAHGLEFAAIKAISDGADFELVRLSRFATADGQFREAAFAAHAAVHPRIWGKVFDLARNSGKAVRALTAALEVYLDECASGEGRAGDRVQETILKLTAQARCEEQPRRDQQ